MGGIALEGVSKVFPGDVVAVDDVELSIGDGEFMVLVGPVGLREVDAAADDRRARGRVERARSGSATAT